MAKISNGYVLIKESKHPRAYCDGYVPEAILICEEALGKPLPLGANPHHVDGNRGNNTNNNLVICQDHAYHMLLHQRTRALKECGHANWRRCNVCKSYYEPKYINIYRKGACCKKCRREIDKIRYINGDNRHGRASQMCTTDSK